MVQDEGMTVDYDDKLYDGTIFLTMRDLNSTLTEHTIDNNFTYKVKEARGRTCIV